MFSLHKTFWSSPNSVVLPAPLSQHNTQEIRHSTQLRLPPCSVFSRAYGGPFSSIYIILTELQNPEPSITPSVIPTCTRTHEKTFLFLDLSRSRYFINIEKCNKNTPPSRPQESLLDSFFKELLVVASHSPAFKIQMTGDLGHAYFETWWPRSIVTWWFKAFRFWSKCRSIFKIFSDPQKSLNNFLSQTWLSGTVFIIEICWYF